jgi:hypothetical protein
LFFPSSGWGGLLVGNLTLGFRFGIRIYKTRDPNPAPIHSGRKGGEMIKASFVLWHDSSEYIEVKGIDFEDKREDYSLHLYDGIIEHCAKKLSNRQMVDVYKGLCIQLQKLGQENTPLIYLKMFEEFKIAMKNRNVSI